MKKTIAVAGATLLTVLAGAGAASAATDTASNDVNVTITGGELTLGVQDTVDFATTAVTGVDKTIETSFASGLFTVSDLTGSQAGWTVSVSADPLSTVGGAAFAEGTLSLDAATAPANTSGATAGVASASGVIDSGAKSVVSAADGAGMGLNSFGFGANALSLVVDGADVEAGDYSTVLNWDVTNAPA